MNKARLIKIIKEEIKKVLSERPINRRAAAAMDDLDAELANVGPGGTSDFAATPSKPQARAQPKPKLKPKPKPELSAREKMQQKLGKASTKSHSEQDRARAVLNIIAPGKADGMGIRMSGKGQKMFLNGVAVPPKYINYILKGGEMPK